MICRGLRNKRNLKFIGKARHNRRLFYFIKSAPFHYKPSHKAYVSVSLQAGIPVSRLKNLKNTTIYSCLATITCVASDLGTGLMKTPQIGTCNNHWLAYSETSDEMLSMNLRWQTGTKNFEDVFEANIFILSQFICARCYLLRK